jgi:cytochrome P450
MNDSNATPSHVPPELVRDFDFYRQPQGGAEPQLALKQQLHGGPDVFWTPHNGGHWVVTRSADILKVLADHENYSSEVVFLPRQSRARFIPLELDPPEHAAYRNVLTPAFTPRTVAGWGEQARALAIELIEGFRPRGACEFVADFAQHLPIVVFLNMCGLPLSDRHQLLQWVNASIRPIDQAAREQAGRNLGQYVSDRLAERRAHPGDDLLSRIVTTEVQGRLMTVEECESMGRGVLGGGLDTVAASMAFAARFLAENPVHAQQLAEHPALINNAIEELFRRYSVPNIARVSRRDQTLKGAPIKTGDMIFMATCTQGLDERAFDDPLRVDFERKNAKLHAVFSRGAHNCPGVYLARAEMRVFLEEWMQRIPRFHIKQGDAPRTATGIVHAVTYLPLEWDRS